MHNILCCLEDWKLKQCPLSSESMLFFFSFLQPPAALWESNLNIKMSGRSVSRPLVSNSRHMTSISFPRAITNSTRVIFQNWCHTSADVIVLLLCLYVCTVVFVCVLLLLLVTSNASLDCIRAEMAVWVLYVCTGDSAFVEFESMFIHYSEVLVNGCVLERVHIAVWV